MSDGEINAPSIVAAWDRALDQLRESGRAPSYIMAAPDIVFAVRRYSRSVRVLVGPDPKDERKPRRLLYKGVPIGVHSEWSWGWMIRATDKSLWPHHSQDASMLPSKRTASL